MRVLFDTNVLVSAILFGGTPRELMRSALRGEVDLVVSPHLLRELEGLLERKFGFTEASATAIRAEMEVAADVVVPSTVKRVCLDRDDDEVLAAAMAGDARFILTGDRDLLVLDLYEGVRIVTPAEFLSLTEN